MDDTAHFSSQHRYSSVTEYLLLIEKEMRRIGLWESEPPSVSALSSQQPFCIDTLLFSQWLQFVFVPRMAGLISQGGPLPVNCDIYPMAEEFFLKQSYSSATLLSLIKKVDEVINDHNRVD